MSLYFYYYCFKCICLYVFSGLDITYQGVTVKGNTLVIKDIIALGSLSSNLGKVVLSYFSFDFHMCPYICVWRDGWSNSIHSVLVSAVSCQSMALSSTLYVLSDPFKFCFLKTRHHYFVWTSWQPVDNKTAKVCGRRCTYDCTYVICAWSKHLHTCGAGFRKTLDFFKNPTRWYFWVLFGFGFFAGVFYLMCSSRCYSHQMNVFCKGK